MEASQVTKPMAKRLRNYFNLGTRTDVFRLDGTDLDLAGFNLIEISNGGYSNKVIVTALGVKCLHELRQKDIENRRGHHDLGSRLSEHLRGRGRITWENVEFKNQIKEQVDKDKTYAYWKAIRPDVFSMVPTLNIKTANPCVHEVKVSRADFLSDIANERKRMGYSLIAEAVYYVAPEGIIEVSDLPQGFGLLVERKEGEFILMKKPKKRSINLEPHHYLNLILKKGQMPGSEFFNPDA